METTALAVVAAEEALGLPSGPMSDSEKRDRDNQHHKIKACSEGIGAALSHVYNNLLFRGDDGTQSWEEYVRVDLPQWLGENPSVDTADKTRALHEAQVLLARCQLAPSLLPSRLSHAKELFGLIPREDKRHDSGTGGRWLPAILDDPDAAQGIAKVWELACQNAERNQRRNGPTAEDVRAAREELRPALEQQGLIRLAPASFQAATAARVEAARQRTVDVTPANAERFKETMAKIRDTKAERTAKVEVDHVREQLDAADRKQRQTLEQEVRTYNARLHDASKAIHELLGYLQTLSRTHGTQLLDEMRCIDVLGLITVKDDMPRLQEMGQELMAAVRLAQSSEPSTGINVQTVEL
jgi:hypothetical protein